MLIFVTSYIQLYVARFQKTFLPNVTLKYVLGTSNAVHELFVYSSLHIYNHVNVYSTIYGSELCLDVANAVEVKKGNIM